MLNLANSLSRFRKNKLYEKQKQEGKIRIVAEGDSWFEYPRKQVSDILNHLGEYYAVYSLAGGGDVLRNMFYKPSYQKTLDQERPDYFLISAGGNDILGKKFQQFLNPYTQDLPGPNSMRFFNDLFEQEIDALSQIFRAIFRKIQSEYPHVQIIVHGYDYVIPLNHLQKGWLGRYLIAAGIQEQSDRETAIRYIIDRFNDMLQNTVKEFGEQVKHLDLRGTIKNHQWHDEIHPNSHGFQDISIKYMDILDRK